MKFTKTAFPDIFLIEPDVFKDTRGFFMETYNQKNYAEAGIDQEFVQDNYSHSKYGILRGLHYQLKNAQGKLVFVITGEIFDIVVDIRIGSPRFGQWFGTYLSAKNKQQIFVPEGYAHGFIVLSESVDVIYKCTDFYTPGDEYGIFWADPNIGIDWPIKNPVLSDKDSKNPNLKEIPEELLPAFHS
ncbi:MAG: dTDP-4-dehydrorhamnose 3,5-epimerase [Thermodesulfobacteriota bacterium]|nr:dTDP-4-dehydrorhamnose 3,5-epimerase [Thermodesulfobacteriota bacterium]